MEAHNKNVATPWCFVRFENHDGEVVKLERRTTPKGKVQERKVKSNGVPVELIER